MDTIAVELMALAIRNMGTEELEMTKVILDQVLNARHEELDECMREIDTFVGDGDTDGDYDPRLSWDPNTLSRIERINNGDDLEEQFERQQKHMRCRCSSIAVSEYGALCPVHDM